MIILDHNIPEDEAQKLRLGKLHFQQIGFEVGRPEWQDQQEILRYLHQTKQPTFFTIWLTLQPDSLVLFVARWDYLVR